MKNKILISTICLAVFLLPSVVFGATTYERTPSGYAIENPVSFSLSVDTYEEFKILLGVSDFSSWWIRVAPLEGAYIDSEAVASSTLSHTFEMNLPFAEYSVVSVQSASGSAILEREGTPPPATIIFEVVEGEPEPAVGVITAGFDKHLPDYTMASTTAHIGGLINSTGGLIWLAIGIPLGFFVIKKSLWLIDIQRKK